MAQAKLPIKDILAAVDMNGKSVWDELTEEEIQELEERSREAQKNREMMLQQEKLEPVIGSESNPYSGKSETVETVKKDTPKFGRNEMVKITDGKNTKELKYKKAQPLIENQGWKII